ncbi:MAG TPA: hypothetical protein VL022_04910 [Moheibacter sp.]|nr:hypothetical protein [Moheibacter sp.]
MAKTSIAQLKSWFRNGLKPTQAQFWNWMDSYWHKDEKLPMDSISGIDEYFNSVTEGFNQLSNYAQRDAQNLEEDDILLWRDLIGTPQFQEVLRKGNQVELTEDAVIFEATFDDDSINAYRSATAIGDTFLLENKEDNIKESSSTSAGGFSYSREKQDENGEVTSSSKIEFSQNSEGRIIDKDTPSEGEGRRLNVAGRDRLNDQFKITHFGPPENLDESGETILTYDAFGLRANRRFWGESAIQLPQAPLGRGLNGNLMGEQEFYFVQFPDLDERISSVTKEMIFTIQSGPIVANENNIINVISSSAFPFEIVEMKFSVNNHDYTGRKSPTKIFTSKNSMGVAEITEMSEGTLVSDPVQFFGDNYIFEEGDSLEFAIYDTDANDPPSNLQVTIVYTRSNSVLQHLQ